MPGTTPGKLFSVKTPLQAEPSHLLLWFFRSVLLKYSKHAGDSNESADHVQIFHLPDSFPVRS
jgi:hypothetical protein